MTVPKGGSRNRSGPQPDPKSRTSERRAYVLDALPAEGFTGTPPDWPLHQHDPDSDNAKRELEVWAEAWRTPQACAWSTESWRWPVVAEYCRLKAIVERSPATSASLITQLHRYRDQIGLTPAGLRENGWAVAKDEVGAKRREKQAGQEGEAAAVRTAAKSAGPRARRLRSPGAQ